MVADFLTVHREYAALIDLALGDWSQRFLVRDMPGLMQAIAGRDQPFSSRVSFLPVGGPDSVNVEYGSDRNATPSVEVSLLGPVPTAASQSLLAQAGVITCADQVVHCEHSELRTLPTQLLGRTLIVRDLTAAWALGAPARGFRLLTLQGELLEPDGTLTVGTHHAEMGILSRKSELREVRAQIAALDRRIADAELDLVNLREQVAVNESRVQQHQQEAQVLGEQAADLRSRLEMQRDRRQGLHEEVTLSRDEMQRAEQEVATLQEAWQQSQQQAAKAEAHVQALYAWIDKAEAHTRQLEQARHQRHQQWTAAKVALAQYEERAAGLRDKFQQMSEDLRQRRQEHAQAQGSLQSCRLRLQESQRVMLAASADLADWYVIKELAEQQLARRQFQRDRDRQERTRLAQSMQSVRGQWQHQQEQFHAHELAANDLRHQRDTLSGRLREDYQFEMAELYQQALRNGLWQQVGQTSEASPILSGEAINEPVDAAVLPVTIPENALAANEEIEDLRRKLHRLGSVNLDSLQELADLELRARTLNAQYEDLAAAKRALEEIINKINHDSKRLFVETYNTVRGHFQELFRKLFGGGMADIVLEDENDVLESGIEIIARPPGKELRSISLMSGGEKTLTAVALLLAIFRSKPSPFCILDEVDAALDEANIGRFADVLREFLDQSHFIIITHSKRTMATADALYGITMQESGISKRVSVRFEDWDQFVGDADNPSAQQVA
jgi:chromosome segregation protein